LLFCQKTNIDLIELCAFAIKPQSCHVFGLLLAAPGLYVQHNIKAAVYLQVYICTPHTEEKEEKRKKEKKRENMDTEERKGKNDLSKREVNRYRLPGGMREIRRT
jgi:hypothetical protein